MQLSLDDLIIQLEANWIESQDQHIARKAEASRKKSTLQKRSNGFGIGEVFRIGLVILSSFLIGNIVTNAGLYSERLHDFIYGAVQIHTSASSDHIAFSQTKKKQYLEALFAKKSDNTKRSIKDEIYSYYNNKSKDLARQFNTAPPDNRIVIAGIWTQAPIVTVEWDIDAKMKEGEFSEELKKWVAFYPGTPDFTQKGTTMIFWHTSNYAWIKSDYNHIFSKIPQLKNGDPITVYRDWKQYDYVVTKQEIVKPQDVPKAYAKEYDPQKKKLMLMGCRPIGTRTSRILVYAEPKWEEKPPIPSTNLAYNPNKTASAQN